MATSAHRRSRATSTSSSARNGSQSEASAELGKPVARAEAETVRHKILSEIRHGRLQPRQRLGSERSLAEYYGVSRSTLRLALDGLERAGIVRRVPGRNGGTFVHEAKIERDLSLFAGAPELFRRQGFLAGTRVISASMRQADELVAEQLQIPLNSPVYDIVRVRLANGEPISLETAALPVGLLPSLLNKPLGGSLTEVLREEYGIRPGRALERIEVTVASADEAQILGVKVGSPLLSIERTEASEDGVPYAFSTDLYRSERTRIVVMSTGQTREVAHSEDGVAIEVQSR